MENGDTGPGGMTFAQFEAFARARNGETFSTLAQRKPFRFAHSPEAFLYTPLATGKERRHGRRFVERVFDRFLEIGSFHPGDYADISKNASYALALIDAYMRDKQKADWPTGPD